MAEKHKINLKTTRKNKTTTKREKNKILKTKSIQREEKSRRQQQQQQGNGRHYKRAGVNTRINRRQKYNSKCNTAKKTSG
jgi:hypothetical protein